MGQSSTMKIKHYTYCPVQNGVAERDGCTLFEKARCKLINDNRPKSLWHLAVQEAACTCNRCFNKDTGTTPYTEMKGKKCLFKNAQLWVIFKCYADEQVQRLNLIQGVFVWHDRYSAAFLVYHPHKDKVQNHKLVKFVPKTTSETETQTQELGLNYSWGCEGKATIEPCEPSAGRKTDSCQPPVDDGEKQPTVTPQATSSRRYPTHKPPGYLKDYTLVDSDGADSTLISMDYCYRAVSGIPFSFKEAMKSTESERWLKATDAEMQPLEDNHTFTLTNSPEGRKTVGGRWVYAMKNGSNGRDQCKTWFLAKG